MLGALPLVIALVVAPPTATDASRRDGDGLTAAPGGERDLARADAAWRAGVAAYKAGRLDAAITHFEEAYRNSGRPGLLFSLGQAHRHRWEGEADERQRHLAIRRFRHYLELEPEGPRAVEAERYLAELLPLSELEGPGESAPATRIGVTSTTPGAIVRIDDAGPWALPSTPDVAPGTHLVEVTAPGFRPARRRVDVPEGSTLSLEIVLDEVEAELAVVAPAGADIYVDGERLAQAPLRGPLHLASGSHEIGVARLGSTLFVRDLELGRGEHASLRADLEPTNQRRISIAGFALGGAAIATGGAFLGVAVDANRRALAIEARREAGSITIDEEEERRRLARLRDDARTTAIATGVIGALLVGASAALFLTDHPPVASVLQRKVGRGRVALLPATTGVTVEGSF